MFVTHNVRAIFTLMPLILALLTSSPQAQEANTTPVQEAELRACLVLEQEGIQRFKKLETAATELRGVENALNDQRMALQNQQNRLKDNKADADTRAKSIAAFNAAISNFNLQADQLNSDKAKFESDAANNDRWMNNTLKPVCDKIANKPVSTITSYYACGHDGKQIVLKVPHCESLPELESLKTCIASSGSKAKALESCKG